MGYRQGFAEHERVETDTNREASHESFLNYEVNLRFDPDLLERVIELPKTFDADLESNIIRNRAKLYRQRLRHGFVYQADSDVLHLMSKNQKKKSLYRTID